MHVGRLSRVSVNSQKQMSQSLQCMTRPLQHKVRQSTQRHFAASGQLMGAWRFALYIALSPNHGLAELCNLQTTATRMHPKITRHNSLSNQYKRRPGSSWAMQQEAAAMGAMRLPDRTVQPKGQAYVPGRKFCQGIGSVRCRTALEKNAVHECAHCRG